MATDIKLAVPNRPGMALKVCETLGDASINIDGIAGDIRAGDRWGYLHVLVEDARAATEALERAGVEVLDTHAVDLVESLNRPGALAEVARSYRERDENIEVLYIANDGRIVIGTESMRSQRLGTRMEAATYRENARS